MERLYYLILNISLLPLRIFRFCCRKKNNDYISLSNNEIINPISDNNYFPKTFISWNIQELFLYQNTKKLINLVNQLLKFNVDLICLQEVFDDKTKDIIISTMKNNYPYYLIGNTDKKYLVGEDSGLMILSKFPITFIDEIKLEGLRWPDSMASKTSLYFSIGELNFVTTHLQSVYEDISKKQLLKLVNDSPFKNFIILGDLNNSDVCNILNLKKNNICSTCDNLILDYILPINYDNLNLSIKVLGINIENTSDHLPIYGEIKST